LNTDVIFLKLTMCKTVMSMWLAVLKPFMGLCVKLSLQCFAQCGTVYEHVFWSDKNNAYVLE